MNHIGRLIGERDPILKLVEDGSPHGLVKIYRPNKSTKKLEYVESVDPFKELTPVNNPYKNYPYKHKIKAETIT